MKIRPFISAILLLVLSGCSTTNISKLVEALGKDTNQVQVVVSTPWGTVTVMRNMQRVLVP